jgi:hypothetical protein
MTEAQLRAVIEQQAGWLREITQERDALKLSAAEAREAARHGVL